MQYFSQFNLFTALMMDSASWQYNILNFVFLKNFVCTCLPLENKVFPHEPHQAPGIPCCSIMSASDFSNLSTLSESLGWVCTRTWIPSSSCVSGTLQVLGKNFVSTNVTSWLSDDSEECKLNFKDNSVMVVSNSSSSLKRNINKKPEKMLHFLH